jgi:hypothetical protein
MEFPMRTRLYLPLWSLADQLVPAGAVGAAALKQRVVGLLVQLAKVVAVARGISIPLAVAEISNLGN